jgi:hypothetical protein
MSLRHRVIPSILNGVSRQPAIMRASDQNEDELNTWSSMSNGLSKRPPAELISKISEGFSADVFIHYINRDTSERYCVIIDGGTIRVFDALTGAEQTVTAPGGLGYLGTGANFRAVTVADYTFIVNADKVCLLDTAGADLVADPTTSVWLNRTPANAVGLTVSDLSGLTGGFAGGTYQYQPNTAGGTFAGEVASIEKLPETAANGTLYKVTGSIETGFVSYYVVREGSVWNETVAPNQINALDASTLPHALVRQADGTFRFAPFSWAPRRVGDADSNPAPTFIGKTISDVFFYQNRLGFLVDENIVFSCSGDFGNFWRNTVLDYIATDVIDHAVATTNVALLKYAVPFNDGLMAFADQTQFSINNGEQGLTPESLAISPVTQYEINTDCRPVNIGMEVYFCGDSNGGSVVWEYTRIEQGDNLNAAEITAHVPGYVPAKLKQLVAAANARALFAIAPDGTVYVYQFYWNGNEKIQSAWRKWELAGQVLAARQMDDFLFVVIKRADGIYLTRINLEEGARPANQQHQVYLDLQCTVTGSYFDVSDTTTFVLPFVPDPSKLQLIRTASHPTAPGSLIDPAQYVWVDARTVRVPGNVTQVTAGESYRQSLTFSRQFPQDYQGRAVTTGRLQLRTFTINFANTAFFRTEVAPYGTAMDPEVEEIVPALLSQFTGKIVGAESLKLNAPAFFTGDYSFQVYGDAEQCSITLSNDTHLGATFVSAEWEGFYFNRATQ